MLRILRHTEFQLYNILNSKKGQEAKFLQKAQNNFFFHLRKHHSFYHSADLSQPICIRRFESS